MKTQDINEQVIPPEPGRSKGKGPSWLAGVGAILVVSLVIAASVLVFAQLGQQHKSQSPVPPAGKWAQALNGYTLASLEAAPGDPSTLYACAVRSQSSQTGTGNKISYTILRSRDFGTHWQDIGSKAALGMSCQLAINPNDSSELYAIGMTASAGAQIASVLKHSLDGGQTWTTIQPALSLPGTSSAPAWQVEQLSMVGNTLFGIQWIPPAANPMAHGGILPRYYARLTRLVRSSDGGHNWTVLDQQFTTTQQGVSDYVVDPTHSGTIYELVSVPWLPILPKAEPNDNVPVYGINGDLYKTSDGGATWHLLLQNLPYGSRLQLAKDNSQVVYVGGSRLLLPNAEQASASGYPNALFHLQMSSDGGATWRAVPDTSQSFQASRLSYIQTWFVSSRGQVYTYSVGSPAPIQRYDPSANTWNAVTAPPISGVLLTVTPGDTNSDVLWFAGTSKGQSVLYRYVS